MRDRLLSTVVLAIVMLASLSTIIDYAKQLAVDYGYAAWVIDNGRVQWQIGEEQQIPPKVIR